MKVLITTLQVPSELHRSQTALNVLKISLMGFRMKFFSKIQRGCRLLSLNLKLNCVSMLRSMTVFISMRYSSSTLQILQYSMRQVISGNSLAMWLLRLPFLTQSLSRLRGTSSLFSSCSLSRLKQQFLRLFSRICLLEQLQFWNQFTQNKRRNPMLQMQMRAKAIQPTAKNKLAYTLLVVLLSVRQTMMSSMNKTSTNTPSRTLSRNSLATFLHLLAQGQVKMNLMISSPWITMSTITCAQTQLKKRGKVSIIRNFLVQERMWQLWGLNHSLMMAHLPASKFQLSNLMFLRQKEYLITNSSNFWELMGMLGNSSRAQYTLSWYRKQQRLTTKQATIEAHLMAEKSKYVNSKTMLRVKYMTAISWKASMVDSKKGLSLLTLAQHLEIKTTSPSRMQETMMINICEQASKMKTPEKPVLLNLNSSKLIASILLVGREEMGTLTKYLLFRDSSSHGGTSKKISEAKKRIPSYRFCGRMVFTNIRQEVICRLFSTSSRNPNFLSSCTPGAVKAVFIEEDREENAQTTPTSVLPMLGGFTQVQETFRV